MLPLLFTARSVAIVLLSGAHPGVPVVVSPDSSAAAPIVEMAQPEKKDAPKGQPPADPPAPAPAPPSTPPAPPSDPSTEDVIRDMEKQRGDAPPPTPSTAPPAVQTPAPAPAPRAGAASGRLLREGTFLVDRRGRMVRSSSGDWTYTFDADARGQADPTMILMPCQKLEAMEKLAERYGESVTFTVTGQVFVYKNRNHLLPAVFRVNRASEDIKTTQ